jgi:solute carrier family 35 protein F1/2
MSDIHQRPSYACADTQTEVDKGVEKIGRNTIEEIPVDKNASTSSTSSEIQESRGFAKIFAVDGPVNGVEAHQQPLPDSNAVDEVDNSKTGFFAYFKTRNFWIILLLGQMLSLCDTGTNIFSEYLAGEGTSIPAFQNMLTYIVLNIVYTSYTMYKYGIKGWGKMVYKDGWRYLIYAFMDVQGNYFTVFAYRYTTILSAQLINFWAIVLVVTISFVFLKVRYHWSQVAGILVCIGGMGILLASDHITGSNGGTAVNQLKGDLFAMAGSTFYGLTNVFEEYLVSKRPLYEVVGQIGFWGTLISGAQTGIFDRPAWRAATWNRSVGGYFAGYTLILTLFYSTAPIMFRMSSAAFFNISLLTGNFWGVITGIQLFHLHVHWMYPIAFVCIVGGLVIYFVGRKALGDSRKAWLGKNQAGGISGVGTARRKAERGNVNAIV